MGDERGLLDFVFHPNFKENRKFYVYYTAKKAPNFVVRISEFLVTSCAV